MDEVTLIEVPASDISRKFCHGDEEAAQHIRAAIRQAVAAERALCATAAEGVPALICAPSHGAWERGYNAGRSAAAAYIRNRTE